jgi:O-antigen ligase
VAAQVIPLPPALRHALSPGAVAFDDITRLDRPGDPWSAPWRPLSIDPGSTAWALAVGAALVVVFWCARAAFARGGVRVTARGIAWFGIVLAAFAVVQHATAPRLLYWYWRPLSPSARPYGPFVNRNDLACWLVMAVPLTVGYGIARLDSRRRGDQRPIDLESALDETAVWLAASACLMTGALFVSLSRSGITAGAAALFALVWMSRGRIDQRRVVWLSAVLATLVVVAAGYANIGALTSRVGDTLTAGIGGRRAIWRETWPMVKDFWQTGIGVGAYERGMLVYQQSPREFFYFNHAHDEYLQLLAEGGVLLGVPAAVAVGAAVWGIVRRLREDRSAAFWIRAGAASGLIAVAVQSVWDVGLRMPANGVLFAILAAIALADVSSGSSAR